MSLPLIGLLTAVAALATASLPRPWRGWFVLVASVVLLYVFQPLLPIRFSGFVLPTAVLGLAIGGWWATQPPLITAEDKFTLALVAALVLLLTLPRTLDPNYLFLANRPPALLMVLGWGAAVALPLGGLGWWLRQTRPHLLAPVLMAILVGLFLLLKAEPSAELIARWWRMGTGQDPTLASSLDVAWLGYSYIAFRLIHTLRDAQSGQLPHLSLREYLTYVLFFPALVAGPIARAEQFTAELRALPDLDGRDPARWHEAGRRLALGLFQKFVLADSLALGLSLTEATAAQTQSTGWLWLLLYGYALRLFWDFSGYTHIALGLGLLLGLRLPENFRHPYAATNLTQFWQRWHITLSDWVRFYLFSPLSRALLRRQPRPSPTLIVLSTQLATMLAIGLWHGISWNFVVWGVWHGLGLFAHKKWGEWTRPWQARARQRPWLWRGAQAAGWFLTFHYVLLGWVWFAVEDTAVAAQILGKLFGNG